jgi:hypothetical protein
MCQWREFDFPNVNASSGNLTLFESVGQSRRINDSTSGGGDEIALGLHQGYLPPACPAIRRHMCYIASASPKAAI